MNNRKSAREMTLRLLAAVAAIALVPLANANAQVVLYDNLDNVRFDDDWTSASGSDRRFAQQFLVADDTVVDSVSLRLQRTGSGPTGSLAVELWHDNGLNKPQPVGSPDSKFADIGTISDVTQLPAGTFANVEFDELSLELDANTPYWVVVEYAGVNGIGGGGQSIGWGVAGAPHPNSSTPNPPEYVPSAGTHAAAFGHLYRDADPSWVDATNAFGIDAFYFSMGVAGAKAQESVYDYGEVRWTNPVPLSETINNEFANADATLTGDGLSIVWSGTRPGTNLPDGSVGGLWTAERASIDSEWENVRPLSAPVDGPLSETDPELTDDGLELFFRRSHFTNGGKEWLEDDELWVASRASRDAEWGEPRRLPASINELTCPSEPAITGDGLELYFRSGCRGRDASIYVAKRSSREEAFGEAELIQEGESITPGVSSDGLHLFFMQFGGSASANSLVVRSRTTRDGQFGPTRALASPPNNSGPEEQTPDISADGRTLYFSTNDPNQIRNNGPTGAWGIFETTIADGCDFNLDGGCDLNDLTRRGLYRVDLTQGSQRASDVFSYDISGDGLVNQLDLEAWLVEAASTNGFGLPYLAGDANLDGTVDFQDFLALAEGFGNGRDWSDGNFNGDREVDFTDFLALTESFGAALTGSNAATVPEPSAALVLIFGVLGLYRRAPAGRVDGSRIRPTGCRP